jgi:hypothetical protein
MAIDLKQSWGDASSKVSSLKTVKETKDSEKTLAKSKANSSKEDNVQNFKKQLSDAKGNVKDKAKKIKSETKNQLELLLDLFKESLPKTGGSSVSSLSMFFLMAAMDLKGKIGDILIDEMVSTIGCSEEQSYDSSINQPFYIKVNQIDLFSQLKISPEDETGKYLYENNQTQNGSFPYSMNKQLYDRLQTPNQSFSQDTNAGNGQNYISASQSPIFNIEYVQNYINQQNLLVTGDFYKVTLNSQPTNKTSVSDFLRDYYQSIDILSFDNLSTNLKNMLTGSFDFSLGKTTDEIKQESKFLLILKRIMGICSDPTKKIDVAGTAKLSDLDNIDDSFFEPTNQEEFISDEIANRIKKGVVEFEDCGKVEFPVNVKSERQSQQDLVNEKKDSKKIQLFEKYVNDITNDPNWKKFKLDIKLSINTSIITKIPMIIIKTVFSPKVLLGFFIMLKAIKNQIGEKIDNAYDDLVGFLKTFKKLILGFVRKIFALFVEKLFEIVKKNIKLLVESILLDIIKESKVKQLQMYSTIIYILMIVGQSVLDYRNCKSVIDEILKLLNLAIKGGNSGLSPFILASSSVLGGISDTRSITNTIENLQKAGLPTGAAPDGGPNLMNVALSSLIKGQNKEMAENGKTQVFIPPLVVTPAGLTLPTVGNGKSY